MDHGPISEASSPAEDRSSVKHPLVERVNHWTIKYKELLALALALATLIVAVIALLE